MAPPPQLSFGVLGLGELMTLQEQIDLIPLFALRMTSKAVCASLDDAAPHAVRLVHWILNKKLVNLGALHNRDLPGFDYGFDVRNIRHDDWAEAHRAMGTNRWMKSTCTRTLQIKDACTRTVLDANRLLEGAALEMPEGSVRLKRFRDMWQRGLLKELRSRVFMVIFGIGNGINQERTISLNEAQSLALLKDIFAHSVLHADEEYTGAAFVCWTPFVFAAVGCKFQIMKFLADQENVNVHWRSTEEDNAYTIVLKDIESDLSWYEEHESEFPSGDIFEGVWPGETHAQFMASAREQVEARYAPVLAYLRDELGLSTQPWNDEEEDDDEPSDYDEEDEEESASEDAGTLSAADAAFKAAWESDDDEW